MNNEAPERIWLERQEVNGTIATIWFKHQIESTDELRYIEYRRVDPPVAPTCANCGHNNFEDRRGYCIEQMPQHFGRALCGCKCEFPVPAPAAPDERDKHLETLLTELSDAAFDCGDYPEHKDDAGYQLLLDREEKAINALKLYIATARAEVWRDAILMVDTAPLCHCAGKQYVDPVALVQRMNAALESARTGKVEG